MKLQPHPLKIFIDYSKRYSIKLFKLEIADTAQIEIGDFQNRLGK